MPPLKEKILPETENDVVFEREVEYSYCIHCFDLYSPQEKVMTVRLLNKRNKVIWWHKGTCPRFVKVRLALDELLDEPTCPLNLCDGSGLWPVLYTNESMTCFCKR